VTPAPEVATALTAAGATAQVPSTTGPAALPAMPRRLALRLRNGWLPRATWTVRRTGRPGLAGLALLVAAALFYLSTYLKVAAEVEALRTDLATAQLHPHAAPVDRMARRGPALPALPARTDMPAILRQLFGEATQAHLAVDTGKYEIKEAKSGAVVRYHLAFPVLGPYPQIREFVDAVLSKMPAVALSDLQLERKSIGEGRVEAQIRMTVYTVETGQGVRSTPGRTDAELAQTSAQPRTPEALPVSDRVVAPEYASALFAPHSWYVPPPRRPPPPPAPPVQQPPPPAPTAPPLPYAFVGSYASEGGHPVFFLSRGDRVIDARVGDRLDGVYQFESATDGQLVFIYLPLNIRQTIPSGASK